MHAQIPGLASLTFCLGTLALPSLRWFPLPWVPPKISCRLVKNSLQHWMICYRLPKQLTQMAILPSLLDSTLLCSSSDLLLWEASCRALSQNPFPREEEFESSALVDGSASWDVLEPAVAVSVSPPDAAGSMLGTGLELGDSLYTSSSCSNSRLENNENWSSDCCGVKLSLVSSVVVLFCSPGSSVSSGSFVSVSRSTWDVVGDTTGSVSAFAEWREFLRPASEDWLPEKPSFARPSLTVGSSGFCGKKIRRNLWRFFLHYMSLTPNSHLNLAVNLYIGISRCHSRGQKFSWQLSIGPHSYFPLYWTSIFRTNFGALAQLWFSPLNLSSFEEFGSFSGNMTHETARYLSVLQTCMSARAGDVMK